jgi:tetratricopeptide (TPR) repeat protein
MARKIHLTTIGCIAVLVVFWVAGCATVPDSADNSRGVELLKNAQVEKAFAQFEKAYQENPENPFALNNMGYVQEMKYKNYAEAARLYQKAIEKAEAGQTRITVSDNRNMNGKPLAQIARENLARVKAKLNQ